MLDALESVVRQDAGLLEGVPGGRDGEDAVDPEDGGRDPHYYIEDFEDGTLTAEEGRTDRRPLLVDETAGPIAGGGGSGSGGLRNDLDTAGAYVAEGFYGNHPEEAGDTQPALRSSDGAGNRAYVTEEQTCIGEPGNIHAVPVAYTVEPETGQGADLRAREIDQAPALTSKNEGVPGYARRRPRRRADRAGGGGDADVEHGVARLPPGRQRESAGWFTEAYGISRATPARGRARRQRRRRTRRAGCGCAIRAWGSAGRSRRP